MRVSLKIFYTILWTLTGVFILWLTYSVIDYVIGLAVDEYDIAIPELALVIIYCSPIGLFIGIVGGKVSKLNTNKTEPE